MKGRLFFSMLVLLLLAPPDAGAQQARLKASLQAPLANPFYGVSMARFKEEVEKRSNKTLIIDIYDNAQLATDDEVVGAVSSGSGTRTSACPAGRWRCSARGAGPSRPWFRSRR
jgi:TRAP-type C4-dicarboxylate transport system substrate-binding protein